MAILDAFVTMTGTATTIRQPSSGVFDRIGTIIQRGDTDAIALYNGSVSLSIFAGSGVTTNPDDSIPLMQSSNMCIIIGNALYIRKGGSSNEVGWSGVQVDT
jgi:hypothetical protein